jgi:hypothetical protein
LSTIKSGSDLPEGEPEATGFRLPLKLVIILIVALVLALIISTQIIGVFYSILFPPNPPLFGNVQLVSHRSPDYGVDTWHYTAAVNPCEVVSYYESNGSTCSLAPYWCTGSVEADRPSANLTNDYVAECIGTQYFSIFAMRWIVNIAAGNNPDSEAQFRLDREVFWSGVVPPRNIPMIIPTEIP